jgi:hypothetical protein
VLLKDLDLEPINVADQFVLTDLFGDISPQYAGGLPPGTADLGLGFRLGFLQLLNAQGYLAHKKTIAFTSQCTGVPRS